MRNLQINYQSIGSGGGIKQVTEGTVDFGASDGPMNDEQLKAFRTSTASRSCTFRRCWARTFPPTTFLASAARAEFHAGSARRNFSRARSPNGTIRLITGANKGVNLPGNDIVVVHRSDGSGTTYIWTDYLSKVSDEWKNKVGKGTSVNWPVGLGGKGNEGVAGLVKQTPNAFGYVELIYAIQNKMPYGKVKNSSGAFIKADLAGVTAAAAGAAKNMPDDFRVSITDAPGKTHIRFPALPGCWCRRSFPTPRKRDAIKGFVKWMLADGQNQTEALSYAKLPKEVVAKEMKALDSIQ